MMSPVIDDGLVAAALFKVVIIFANLFYKKISCDFLTFLFAFSSFCVFKFCVFAFCVFAFCVLRFSYVLRFFVKRRVKHFATHIAKC